MRVFFDSSAFAKRHINEAGTDKVLEWCDQATEIGLSVVALPEIISALCRLRREGKINDTQYRQLKSLLLADIEGAAICDLTPNGAGAIDHQPGKQCAARHGCHSHWCRRGLEGRRVRNGRRTATRSRG